MDEKFKRFNEITFEAYCKTAIDNAVKKAAMGKQKRGELERPITDLTDADLYRLSAVSPAAEDEMQECTHFYIADRKITVHDPTLAGVLTYLPPRSRNVLLLSFFEGMSNSQIAKELGISKSRVQQIRNEALMQLKPLFKEFS